VSATPDLYTYLLASAGKLEMRATAKLAEGTPDSVFDACVLLHEAARIERRALHALLSPPAIARLTASVEECFCLVEGLDPTGAAGAWARVDHERSLIADDTTALLARLEPRYQQTLRDFQELLGRCKTLVAHLRVGHEVPSTPSERAAELRDVQKVLKRFPGAAIFWWRAYRLQEADGLFSDAWRSLSRARQLAPENPTYVALSLVLAVKALPPQEADEHLQQARAALDDFGPEVCLMYAHAELERAEKAHERTHWLNARDAVERGLSVPSTSELSKNLRATRLILDSLLAGREPSLDILYKVGLGEEVAAAPPGGKVVELVARRSKRQVSVSALAA
jgi:hypothetical protein